MEHAEFPHPLQAQFQEFCDLQQQLLEQNKKRQELRDKLKELRTSAEEYFVFMKRTQVPLVDDFYLTMAKDWERKPLNQASVHETISELLQSVNHIPKEKAEEFAELCVMHIYDKKPNGQVLTVRKSRKKRKLDGDDFQAMQ